MKKANVEENKACYHIGCTAKSAARLWWRRKRQTKQNVAPWRNMRCGIAAYISESAISQWFIAAGSEKRKSSGSVAERKIMAK